MVALRFEVFTLAASFSQSLSLTLHSSPSHSFSVSFSFRQLVCLVFFFRGHFVLSLTVFACRLVLLASLSCFCFLASHKEISAQF